MCANATWTRQIGHTVSASVFKCFAYVPSAACMPARIRRCGHTAQSQCHAHVPRILHTHLPEALHRSAVYLLYRYKSTNTDVGLERAAAAAQCALATPVSISHSIRQHTSAYVSIRARVTLIRTPGFANWRAPGMSAQCAYPEPFVPPARLCSRGDCWI